MILALIIISCHVSDYATCLHFTTHLARRCRDACSCVRVLPARLCPSAQSVFVMARRCCRRARLRHRRQRAAASRRLPCFARSCLLCRSYVGWWTKGSRCDYASGVKSFRASQPLAPRPSVERVGGEEGTRRDGRSCPLCRHGQQDERPHDGASRRGRSRSESITAQVNRAPGKRQGRRNGGWRLRRGADTRINPHQQPIDGQATIG